MTTATHKLQDIALTLLFESTTNPRVVWDEVKQQELAASIRAQGLISPITVRPRPTQVGPKAKLSGLPVPAYEVVAGARRFRACKAAGLDEIACIVRDLDDRAVLEVQIVENLQRDNPHPLDEGNGYRKLIEAGHYTADTLAERVSRSRGYVYGRMLLAKMPKKAQQLFIDGKFDLSIAQLIARIPVPSMADEAAAAVVKGNYEGKPLTFRAARDLIDHHYRNDLREAKFDTADAKLVEKAGACGPCPFRTGNQKDLFGGSDEKDRADICTHPECWQSKVDATFELQKAKVVAAGGKVIEGKAAEQYDPNRVGLDERCSDDPKQRTYRQLLGKSRDGVAVNLVRDRDGETREVVDKRSVIAVAKHNGVDLKRGAAAARNPEQAKHAREARDRQKALPVVLAAVAEKGADLDAAQAWQLVIANALDGSEQIKVVSRRRGIDLGKKREALLEMKVKELQGLALELVAAKYGASGLQGGAYSFNDSVRNVCRATGVDIKRAIAGVAKERAAKKPAKGKAKPKGKAAAKRESSVPWIVEQLKAKRSSTYGELQKRAVDDGRRIFPIEFGRAQAMLGIDKLVKVTASVKRHRKLVARELAKQEAEA